MLFCTLVLVTGPIWARPIWGVWWTWDPRLTMTVILWAIYARYLMLRAFGGDEDAVARYAAVLGIVGVLDIPVIRVSVRLLQGIHPAVLDDQGRRVGPHRSRRCALTLYVVVARHAAARRVAGGAARAHARAWSPRWRRCAARSRRARGRRMNGNLGYLFAAYTAVWLGIFLYVRRLARRGRELEEEIARPAPTPRALTLAAARASRAVADVVKPAAMRFVVCVKYVPVLSQLRFDPATRRLVREGVRGEVSSFDVRALLGALRLRAAHGGEVVVLTMGPPAAREALTYCLALGADRGVHLCDPALAGSDTLATARALAARPAPRARPISSCSAVRASTPRPGRSVRRSRSCSTCRRRPPCAG